MDNPRPFSNLLPKSKMKIGEMYEGWKCRACGLVMAIDQNAPMSIRLLNETALAIVCPHCQHPDTRTWGARERHEYSAST